MTLNFTVDKPLDWVGYSLDGKQNVTVTSNCTIPDLNDGAHSLVVYANSTYGGLGASEKVVFTISHYNQYVLLAVVAIVVLVAAVSVFLYFKRRRNPSR